jgi:hypothetical protein
MMAKRIAFWWVLLALVGTSAFAQPPSLDSVVRQVAAARPDLLQTNTNATCFAFVQLVLKTANDPHWGHVAKTRGEGQYTPTTWTPTTGIGRDGNAYQLTGVSHDAIYYCANPGIDTAGRPVCHYSSGDWQVDLLGAGNDSDHAIFDASGQRIVARPQWGVVPQEFYRAKNPWLAPLGTTATLPPPTPPAPVVKPYPGDAYFIEKIGQLLEWDYAEAGQRLNAGSSVWFSRTIWRHVNEGLSIEQSTAQSRKEWRAALGLPPLP